MPIYSEDEKRCIITIAKWFKENREFISRDDAMAELGIDVAQYDPLIKTMVDFGAIKKVSSADQCYGIFLWPSSYAVQLEREIETSGLQTISTQTEQRHFPHTKQPIDPMKCFILMPIEKGFEDIYHDVLKPTLEEMGLRVVRADEIYSKNPIMEDIWENIQTAGLIIADVTGRNPNVFYETGLAHAIGRDVIFVTQNMDDIPFDLRHWRHIVYEQTIRGAKVLQEKLKQTIIQDKQYVKVPIELITTKLKGGFIVDKTATTMHFTGINGMDAELKEEWVITPSRENPLQSFYRKIATDGLLSDIKSENCSVDCREFLTGNYLLAISSELALHKGKTFAYGLSYKILNGFEPGHEIWTFGIEAETKHLSYSLVFKHECIPLSLEAFMRGAAEKPAKPVDMNVTKTEISETYSIVLNDLPIGASIAFRWKWPEK